MSESTQGSQPTQCPMCGSHDVQVVEDVSDEVTVYGCQSCDATWADRND